MRNTPIAKVIFMCALLAGGPLLTGCASDQQVIGQAQQFHGGIKPAVIDKNEDRQLAAYLQKVGNRIIDAVRTLDEQQYGPDGHSEEDNAWMFSKDMKFHFVNSKTLNAFTTGGEHMYIYTELFEQAKTEDELAAVMAHEFAHVYARHVHSGMNRQLPLLLGGAALGGAAGYALGGEDNKMETAAAGAGIGAAGSQFVGMGFTRKDEAEADALGFDFYVRAGWDPDRFGDFFQTMIDAGYDKTPAMLSDHPTLASRVDAAEKRAADLPPEAREWRRKPVADADEFERLQKRAKRVGKNMPDDQSLAGAQELAQAMPRSCLTPQEPKDQQEAQQRLIQRAQASGEDDKVTR